MAIIAATFDRDENLNAAIGELLEQGIYPEDIFLMRGATAQVVAPMPNIAEAAGDLENLRMTEEERKKFTEAVMKGDSVCLVYVEPDQKRVAENALQRAREVIDLSDS